MRVARDGEQRVLSGERDILEDPGTRGRYVAADESSFVAWRERRDATLGAPRLLHPALQVNIRAGKLPPKDAKGRTWFRTPVRGVQW